MNQDAHLSFRIPSDSRATHHLYRVANRYWSVSYTVHAGPIKHRIRKSLGPCLSVDEAIRRRDEILSAYQKGSGEAA